MRMHDLGLYRIYIPYKNGLIFHVHRKDSIVNRILKGKMNCEYSCGLG